MPPTQRRWIAKLRRHTRSSWRGRRAMRPDRTRRLIALFALALALTVRCGGASDKKGGGGTGTSGNGGDKTLSLVAYSTPQVVYDEIIPAFNKTATGEGIRFK